MKISLFNNLEILSSYAAYIIINQLENKNDLLLCAASGSSPTLTYELLNSNKNRVSFEKLRIVKLDEWGGVPMNHAGSCETYLQKYLIEPLQIKKDNYYSFQSISENPKNECERIQQLINENKQIDLCVLGLGQNGHIAFNEPADYLQANCHVAALSESSMNHSMAKDMKTGSVYGLTLGMSEILNSKKIVLIITGKNKDNIIKQFLSRKISTHLPASFLWLHPDVDCLIDKESTEVATIETINNNLQ